MKERGCLDNEREYFENITKRCDMLALFKSENRKSGQLKLPITQIIKKEWCYGY